MRKRSKLNLSNFHNITGLMGRVIPVNLTEVLPGDSIQQSTSVFMRLAPMVAPVMHPVHISVLHYFIPTRILWQSFEDFITGGADGLDESVPPTVTLTPEAGSLADYFGLPLGHEITVSALPFRAYAMIYNEYIRDQQLQDELSISLEDGPDTTTSTVLKQCCWAKDYFTTASPSPQLGPQITIPVNFVADGSTANINITGTGSPTFSRAGSPTWTPGSLTAARDDDTVYQKPGSPGSQQLYGLSWNDPALTGSFAAGTIGTGYVDVNAIRQGLASQRFSEHRNLFGARYEDYLRYLGVKPSDARLQMPEYLGGSSQVVQFSEVLQTSADSSDSGVGALFGHGIGAMKTGRYRRFIPEHGYIMSLMYVRPIPVYAQGIERLWTRKSKSDYWQVELQHIGQQEIYNREVYADGTSDDDIVFGYQNRYDEYRRGVNLVCGEFRTNQEYWTMARIFSNRPALNSDFVECLPTDRIFQLTEQNSDQLYCMVKNNIIARRLVDRNGNPM